MVFEIPEDETEWQYSATEGHTYIRLSEKLPADDAYLIAEWQNADQNQNQVNSLAQHVRLA